MNVFRRLRINQDVSFILKRIASAGHEAYLVGGCLRNYLLKRAVVDWDIATNAPPQAILALFRKALPLGIAHGTVTVVHNKTHFEITSYRSHGRRKKGEGIEEDLAHRDFTINALAYDPVARRMLDPFHGEADLKRKVLRAVGDPSLRFHEDPLRALRCIRLACELEFRIHKETLAAIPGVVKPTKLLPVERVRNEFLKILQSGKCMEGVDLLRKTGLLGVIVPELLGTYRVKQRERFHAYDVYKHSLFTVRFLPPDPVLRMAGLLHDIGKPGVRKKIKGEYRFYGHEDLGAKMAEGALKRLKFSSAQRTRVVHLVKNHMFHYEKKWKDVAVKRLVNRLGEKNLEDFLLLFEADKRASGIEGVDISPVKNLKRRIEKLQQRGDALKLSDLAVTGKDVMDVLGIEPGKEVGEALHALLQAVLKDPGQNTPKKLKGLLSLLAR